MHRGRGSIKQQWQLNLAQTRLAGMYVRLAQDEAETTVCQACLH